MKIIAIVVGNDQPYKIWIISFKSDFNPKLKYARNVATEKRRKKHDYFRS